MSPLAKADPTRPGLAARFELFVNGSELCNAYQELNDPDEQRARFQSQLEQREKGDDECTAIELGREIFSIVFLNHFPRGV